MTATFPSEGGAAAGVATFNGRAGAVTLQQADVNALDVATDTELAAEAATRVAAAGAHSALTTGAHNLAALLGAKADLVGGLVPTAQIPALAITDVFPVASQAAMLALLAQRGDVAIRSDTTQAFILATDSPGTLADWKLLPTPADAVLSVNGQAGVVVLAKGDVGLGNVDNTSDANKPVSTAQTAAIAAAAIAGDVTGTLAGATVAKVRGKNIPAPGASEDQKTWIYDHATGAMVWTALPAGGSTESLWWPNLVAPADPVLLCGGLAVMGAGQARTCRVTVPKTGNLRDLAIFVGGASGNVDIGVYSTASTRVRLYHSGSVACPAANAWRIVGDPNLAVTKGDQLDLMLGCDNASAAFGRIPMNSSTFTLPAGFLPGGGGLPKLAAIIGSGFPLAATYNEGDLSDTVSCISIIGRIS